MKLMDKRGLVRFLFLPAIVIVLFFLGIISLMFRNQTNKQVSLDEVDSVSKDTSFEVGGLPIYKDSQLVTFAASDDGTGRSFIWETEDEAGLVYEYLKSELRIDGWELYDESSVGSSSAVSFEKEGCGGFLGVFTGSGGKTIISVSIRKP